MDSYIEYMPLRIRQHKLANDINLIETYGMNILSLHSYGYSPDLLKIKSEPYLSYLHYFYNNYRIIAHVGYPGMYTWSQDIKTIHDFKKHHKYSPDDLICKIGDFSKVSISIHQGAYFATANSNEYSLLFNIIDYDVFNILLDYLFYRDSIALYVCRKEDNDALSKIISTLSIFTTSHDKIYEILQCAKHIITTGYDGCIYLMYTKDSIDSYDVKTPCEIAAKYILNTKWYHENEIKLKWDDDAEFCYRIKKD